MGKKEKHKSSDKNDNLRSTINKQEAYLRIRELLREYKQIVSLGDVTQGKRLLECLNSILENLKYFPEYINEKSINTILKEVQISDEDLNKYTRLLNIYNSLNDELEKSNLGLESDTVKTELDRRIEQITENEHSADIDDGNKKDYTKIANKINYLSEMAEIISPIMQDPEINSIIATLSQFFDRDLTKHRLTISEKDKIRDRIIGFEKRRKLRNSRGEELEDIYLYHDTDLISEEKIGENYYILIRDEYKKSRKTEIHTMNGIYEIDASDKTNVGLSHIFTRDGKNCTLDVFMPIEPDGFEKVNFSKQNKEDEIYMKIGKKDYSVHKRSGSSEAVFYYDSKEDVLNARPSRSERRKEGNSINLLSFLVPKIIEPELDATTCSAIKHSIKGVLPKEVLELYRTTNPEIASLIENYGVEVQENRISKISLPIKGISAHKPEDNNGKKRRSTPEDHEEPE